MSSTKSRSSSSCEVPSSPGSFPFHRLPYHPVDHEEKQESQHSATLLYSRHHWEEVCHLIVANPSALEVLVKGVHHLDELLRDSTLFYDDPEAVSFPPG